MALNTIALTINPKGPIATHIGRRSFYCIVPENKYFLFACFEIRFYLDLDIQCRVEIIHISKNSFFSVEFRQNMRTVFVLGYMLQVTRVECLPFSLLTIETDILSVENSDSCLTSLIIGL